MKGAIILLALLCSGCGQKLIDDMNQARRESNARGGYEVDIYLDSGTGCQYVGIQGRALTPRIGTDGKQICRKPSP